MTICITLLMLVVVSRAAGFRIPETISVQVNKTCKVPDKPCKEGSYIPDVHQHVCWKCTDDLLCSCQIDNNDNRSYTNIHPDCTNMYVYDDKKCLSDCTKDQFIHNFQCVSHCPGDMRNFTNICFPQSIVLFDSAPTGCSGSSAPYHYNGSCVISCPKLAPYKLVTNGKVQCQSDCPVGYFVNGEYCVPCDETCNQTAGCVGPSAQDCNVCSTAQIENKGERKCTLICPDEKPNYMKENKNDVYECVSDCPDFSQMISDKAVCIDKCPDNMTYAVQGQCSFECPPHLKYFIYDKNITLCLDKCDDQFVAVPVRDGHYNCVSYCPNDLSFLIHGVCSSKCPLNMTYRRQEHSMTICLNICEEGYYINGADNTCTRSCLEPFPFKWMNFCLSGCPQDAPYYWTNNYECVRACSPSYEWHDGSCILYCSLEKSFYFHDKCFPECPEGQPFIYEAHRRKECFKNCPALTLHLLNDTECFSSCPKTMSFTFNRACLKTCPNEYPYFSMQSKECLSECPNNMVHMPGEVLCLHGCPQNTSFIMDGACVFVCPSSNPYYMAEDQICSHKCPSGKFHMPNGFECLEKCPDEMFHTKSTCLSSCPRTMPFYNQSDNQGKECLFECKGLHYGHKCVNECPPDEYFSINNTCVTKCPSTFYYYSNHDDLYYECLASCAPDDVIINQSICQKSCPRERPWKQGKHCVSECSEPYRAPVENYTYTCIKSISITMLILFLVFLCGFTGQFSAGLVYGYHVRRRKVPRDERQLILYGLSQSLKPDSDDDHSDPTEDTSERILHTQVSEPSQHELYTDPDLIESL